MTTKYPNKSEIQSTEYLHSGSGNLIIGGSFVPSPTCPINGSNLPHPHPEFVGRESNNRR